MPDLITAAPWVLVAGGFHKHGGMDRANLALAEYLSAKNCRVELVAHSVDECLQQRPGITSHVVPRPAGSVLLGERQLDAAGRKVIRQVEARAGRAHVVANGGNCIWPGANWVHYVHHAWSDARPGAPLHARLKGSIFSTVGRIREQWALSAAQVVVANSRKTLRDLTELAGVGQEKLEVIYLGADPTWGRITTREREAARQHFDLAPDRPVAAFVGALSRDRKKGFDTLFAAWRDLCSNPAWNADLLVAGAGADLEYWRSSVRRAGLEARVRLLGFTFNIPQVLAAADLLISPSRYDSYGLNVQEALCRGLPALVSTRAGVSERFDDALSDLLLPDPDDRAMLARRLIAWQRDPEDWRRRCELLGARLRAHTWDDMAAQLADVVANGLMRRSLAARGAQ